MLPVPISHLTPSTPPVPQSSYQPLTLTPSKDQQAAAIDVTVDSAPVAALIAELRLRNSGPKAAGGALATRLAAALPDWTFSPQHLGSEVASRDDRCTLHGRSYLLELNATLPGAGVSARALRDQLLAAALERPLADITDLPPATGTQTRRFTLRLTLLREPRSFWPPRQDACKDASTEDFVTLLAAVVATTDDERAAVHAASDDLVDPHNVSTRGSQAYNLCQTFELALPIGVERGGAMARADARQLAAAGLFDPDPLELISLPLPLSMAVQLDGRLLAPSKTAGFSFDPISKRLLLHDVAWGPGSQLLVGYFTTTRLLLGGIDQGKDCQ